LRIKKEVDGVDDQLVRQIITRATVHKVRFNSPRSLTPERVLHYRVAKKPVHENRPQLAKDWSRIIPGVAVGDHDALAALYDAASSVVFGLALRILNDRELAEDVVVEVFAQIWRDAKSYDAVRGSAASWILSATRSRAIDMLRTRKRDSATDPIESAAQVQSALPNPEEASALGERQKFVRGALDSLTVEQREVIELAYFSGLSHNQIALKLGQPLGTIKTRIRMAMMRLRELLGHIRRPVAELKENAG
jgi:RNA polymerase sigma-70 factor (ECF subfamily)